MNQWTQWKSMPSPHNAKNIEGPTGPGVYQIRNTKTGENIQFGISVACQSRMKSLFPKPFGTGTRNNEDKRIYILNNWKDLEYRTLTTNTREDAKKIEDQIKTKKNHLFNT